MFKKIIYFSFIALILILTSISFAEEEHYYVSFSPNQPCYYPGDKCSVNLNIYYYDLKEKGDIEEKVTMEIFKIPPYVSCDDFRTHLSGEKPVDRMEKDIILKHDSSNYWTNYSTIDLPSLPSGFYYVKCKLEKAETYGVIKISRLGLSVKPAKDEIIFFAQDRKTGSSMKDIEITLFKDNKKIKVLKTDDQGLAKLNETKELKQGDTFKILALSGEDRAEADISLYNMPVEYKGYIFTDRPIYRPGQKVNFKAILRYNGGEELKFAGNEEVNIIIRDPDNGETYNKKLKTDEYGSLSGDLTLKEKAPLGYYNIYCVIKGENKSTGSFRVEEYRKPEFEIKLSAEKENYIQGEKINIDLNASYYFGAPLPDKEYTYEIYKDYYYPWYYTYWWEEAFMPYYSSYGGEVVSSGKGKTDKDGKSIISYKTEKIENDSIYKVLVKMVDESRREVTSSVSSRVTRGAYYLEVDTDRYYSSPGEKITVKVKAQDYSQKPVATESSVNIRYEKYDEKKKSSDWVDVKKSELKTDKQGIAYMEFTPEKDGYYEIECAGEDQYKNTIKTSGYFYCSSDNGLYNWYRFTDLEIIPDKKYYHIGDEANILIVCPFENVKALVTVDGDSIINKKIMTFHNKTGNLKVKISDLCSPDFFITVSFYYDGYFRYTNKKIICPREDKFLTLLIKPDKEKYKPRDTAKFTIETKDYKNRPVSAQVTMGVADESVYAVAGDDTPNIQKFFYGSKNSYIYTYSSEGEQYADYMNYYTAYMKGGIMPPEAMPPPPAPPPPPPQLNTAPQQNQVIQPEFIRNFFPDTAYFNPSIITDEKGLAEVLVPLPDTLTTWRATGHGVTKKTQAGEAREKVIVTKNLLARLITPRFLTERDETLITGIVHNYLKNKKTVYMTLEAQGGVSILDKGECKIEVPPDSALPVNWKIKALRSGDTKFTLKALTDEESDAVELTVPVLGHGSEKYVAVAGSTKDKTEEFLSLPDEADRESARCFIKLDPSLAGSMFSSLDYLVSYPYGCTEQTMSRFLPTIIVAKTLGELDIYNEKINKDLPDMVDKGLKRLYNFHHSDGGWGWWEYDESHPFMTAYVVYGLSLAKQSGYTVDQNIFNSGIKWLRDNYGKQKDLNTRSYMAFCVTTAGEKTEDWLLDLYNNREKLDSYAKAVLAISLQKSGLNSQAKDLVNLLEKTGTITGTTAFWSGKTDAHGWTDNQIETTSYALKALISIKPESELLPKIIRFLTQNRRGSYWYSTKDTASVIMALTDYLKISKEMNPDFTADIYFNGTKIDSVRFTKEDVSKEGHEISIPFDRGLLQGKNNLKIEVKGKGVLYYAAYLKYFTKGENVTSENSGISIKRTYYLLKPGEKEDKKIKLGSEGNIKINCQDRILVELELNGQSNYDYVIIEDPKPAGCEVDDSLNYSSWNYWFAHREVRDEKIAYFCTGYYGGKQILSYKLRAETPGTFHVMPARAYLMYIPEIGGNSEELIVEVK